jgi:phosphopentomutase
MVVNRVVLIVLDGLGIGALPDAADYGDTGSNTLAHVAAKAGGLHVPTFESLGLGYLGDFPGVRRSGDPDGCFGKMASRAKGHDSLTGYWEMAGVIVDRPFPTYPDGVPGSVIEPFERAIGRKVLGNRAASETDMIQEFGEEHRRTGAPIVYTSANSVVQIAAHEQVAPPEELYAWCRTARKLLTPPHHVARVIARPFTGTGGEFTPTVRRRDFPVSPHDQTLLDKLSASGQPVIGIGKITDLFGGRGLTRSIQTPADGDNLREAVKLLQTAPRGLIIVDVVELDALYGYRHDPAKWARAYARVIEGVDAKLPRLLQALRPDDLLCVTADHGCDRMTSSGDHTREHVPVLIYGPRLARGVNLGVRRTFADLGQTIAEALRTSLLTAGQSFLPALRAG